MGLNFFKFSEKIIISINTGLIIAISQSYDFLLCPFSSKDILFKKEFLFLIDFFSLIKIFAPR